MTHAPEPAPDEAARAEEPRPATARLPDISSAFPEAREAVRQLADRDGEESPEDAVDLEAELPADDVATPTAPLARSRRTGEGLRGSDEFIRARAAATPEGAPEAPASLPEVDPEAIARAAAALDRRWDALVAQAEDAMRIAGLVLDPLESKIGAVRVGLDLAGRTAEDREGRIALLPPEIHALMRGMVNRIHADAHIARRLQIALFQFGDARRAIGALQERLARAAELPRDEGIAFLSKVEVPKVKGKLYVVSNFPNVFRGDPVLGRLFPLRGATGPTAAPTGPLPAAPPTTPTPPPANPAAAPKPGTGNLREAWDAVRSALGKRKPG